jgi:DNA-binding CsgD family transcriptional regulator
VKFSALAGDRAMLHLAFEDAAQCFGQALQALQFRPEPDEARLCDLLLRCGEAQNAAGAVEDAKKSFLLAAPLASRLGDAESFARAALGYGAVADTGNVDPLRASLLEQALGGLGDRDSLLTIRVLDELASAHFWSARPAASLEVSEQALRMAERLANPEARAHALHARREALWQPEHIAERLMISTAMLQAARKANNSHQTLNALRWLIADTLESGDGAAVIEHVEAHDRVARAVRQPLHLWYAARWQAMLALLHGRLSEADKLIVSAQSLGRRAQRGDADALALVQMAALRRMQGRAAEIRPALQGLVERFPDAPVWRAGLASVLAESGQLEQARQHYQHSMSAGFTRIPVDANWLVTLTLLAQTAVLLADREGATALYDLLQPYAEQVVVAGAAVACHGAVAFYLGILAAMLNRCDVAQEHFDRALALHGSLKAFPWLSLTQCSYAEMLLQRATGDDRYRALQLIEQAQTVAQDLHLAPLAARLTDLRRRHAESGPSVVAGTGAAVRMAAAKLARPLTPREREIVTLLILGKTNRQIAGQLTISERTADAHVANILGKLDLHSRLDVRTWAIEHGFAQGPGAPL